MIHLSTTAQSQCTTTNTLCIPRTEVIIIITVITNHTLTQKKYEIIHSTLLNSSCYNTNKYNQYIVCEFINAHQKQHKQSMKKPAVHPSHNPLGKYGINMQSQQSMVSLYIESTTTKYKKYIATNRDVDQLRMPTIENVAILTKWKLIQINLY